MPRPLSELRGCLPACVPQTCETAGLEGERLGEREDETLYAVHASATSIIAVIASTVLALTAVPVMDATSSAAAQPSRLTPAPRRGVAHADACEKPGDGGMAKALGELRRPPPHAGEAIAGVNAGDDGIRCAPPPSPTRGSVTPPVA